MPRPYEVSFRSSNTDPIPVPPEAMLEITSGEERMLSYLVAAAERHTGSPSREFEPGAEERLLLQLAEAREAREKIAAIDEAILVAKDTDLRGLLNERRVLYPIKKQGEAARDILVETHGRFAHWMALASTGIVSRKPGDPAAEKGLVVGRRGSITKLASPYAELEDRKQFGLEGLIRGIDTYDPHQNRAKLTTYAARSIFSRIERGIAHTDTMETCGPRVTQDVLSQIRTAYVKYKTNNLFEAAKTAEGEERHRLLQLAQWEQAQYQLSIDDLEYPHAAEEETWDIDAEEVWSTDCGEPPVLGLADIYPDDNQASAFNVTSDKVLKAQVADALTTLSEREAGVIRLRFGLGTEEPCTLDQIAQVYGVTRDRIHQIETNALDKLRHSSRSDLLRDFLNDDFEVRPNVLVGAGLIRTVRELATKAISAEKTITEQQADELSNETQLKSWQTTPGEPWDTRMRVVYERPERGTARYNEIYNQFIAHLKAPDNCYQYQTPYAELVRTPYPKALHKSIEEMFGPDLTPAHIEDFWNSSFKPFVESLEKTLGDEFNVDRVTQLVSILLSDRMKDTDSVRLHIPPEYADKCNFLGAWAKNGEIVIVGNAGDYTGQAMQDMASIRVIGNVGDFTANNIRGFARLEVTGHAGRYLGRHASGNTAIVVNGYAGERAGTNLRGHAEVRDQENIWLAETYKPASTSKDKDPEAADDDSPEGRLSIEQVRANLGLNAKALNYYLAQCGMESNTDISVDDLDALMGLFPELYIPILPEGEDLVALSDIKEQMGYAGTVQELTDELRSRRVTIRNFRTVDGTVQGYISRISSKLDLS